MSDDPILDRLVKIRREFHEILAAEGYVPQLPEETQKQASRAGLTSNEAKGWCKTEPDFARRIVNRNRKQDFMRGAFLLILMLPHVAVAITVTRLAPNGLPHLYPPNVDDALPYDR